MDQKKEIISINFQAKIEEKNGNHDLIAASQMRGFGAFLCHISA